MKQWYCVSTVQASSRVSGLVHEQKLVIEMSREETEARKCSEVCLLHPGAALMNNVVCWEAAGTAEPCLAWVVPLFGFDLQPFLCFLEHPGHSMRTPDGFGGGETHKNPEELFLQSSLVSVN